MPEINHDPIEEIDTYEENEEIDEYEKLLKKEKLKASEKACEDYYKQFEPMATDMIKAYLALEDKENAEEKLKAFVDYIYPFFQKKARQYASFIGIRDADEFLNNWIMQRFYGVNMLGDSDPKRYYISYKEHLENEGTKPFTQYIAPKFIGDMKRIAGRERGNVEQATEDMDQYTEMESPNVTSAVSRDKFLKNDLVRLVSDVAAQFQFFFDRINQTNRDAVKGIRPTGKELMDCLVERNADEFKLIAYQMYYNRYRTCFYQFLEDRQYAVKIKRLIPEVYRQEMDVYNERMRDVLKRQAMKTAGERIMDHTAAELCIQINESYGAYFDSFFWDAAEAAEETDRKTTECDDYMQILSDRIRERGTGDVAFRGEEVRTHLTDWKNMVENKTKKEYTEFKRGLNRIFEAYCMGEYYGK